MKYCISILFGVFALLLNPIRAQTISGVVNSYYVVNSVNNATNSARLVSASGLSVGMRVLLIEMKGATVDQTQTAAFGNITAINNAGKYEFAQICAIVVDTVYFKNVLVNNYDPTGAIQLVTVPQYTNVMVSATLTAGAWNPATRTGGVLVFEASGTVTLNADIDASGMGFRGGAKVNYNDAIYNCIWTTDPSVYYTSIPPTLTNPNNYYTGGTKGEGIADSIASKNFAKGKLANGGGGGNNHNTGGAGGSNYGAGGDGGRRSNETLLQCHGTNPGLGGLALGGQGYTVANNRIFMGGGGGNGQANNNENLDGGNGGGIVLIKCSQMIGNSFAIRANGTTTLSAFADNLSSGGDGASGGGGGGVVILNTSSLSGNLTVEAKGGRGNNSSYNVSQCLGPGGGGGGGVVWIAAGAVPVNVSASVAGGANGVVSNFCTTAACRNQANSATAGSVGASLVNYVAPEGPLFSCSILPADPILRFTARLINEQAQLNWMVNDPSSLRAFIVQRSLDGIHFTNISAIAANSSGTYEFAESMNGDERRFYRILVQDKNGSISYSPIAEVSSGSGLNHSLQLFPNPARDEVVIRLHSNGVTRAELILMDAMGKLVKRLSLNLFNGENHFTLPIESLGNGVYFVRVNVLDETVSARFIKMK